MSSTDLALAVDIGGTFTDVALRNGTTGEVWRAKTPSTPEDPSEAFLDGIRQVLSDAGLEAPALTEVLHGTTVATNMILEGKGARGRISELKNGRLAMIAVASFVAGCKIPGSVPLLPASWH